MEFYSEACYTARKEHRCEMCGRKIARGEQYVYQSGKWDGDFFTRKLHRQCNLLLYDYCTEVDEEFTYSSVLEYAEEQYCHDCEHAACNDDREGWTECKEDVTTCPKVLTKMMDGRGTQAAVADALDEIRM